MPLIPNQSRMLSLLVLGVPSVLIVVSHLFPLMGVLCVSFATRSIARMMSVVTKFPLPKRSRSLVPRSPFTPPMTQHYPVSPLSIYVASNDEPPTVLL